jgi:ketosteroid isomerase-like protein
MPYVNLTLARGKSREYLEHVSEAVHEALVEGLGMQPGDRFQEIHQLDPADLVFDRDFRGGPRSDDFMVLRITEGLQRTEAVKRRFYQTLAGKLEAGAGVRPEDVFVILGRSDIGDFSFAGGVSASEVWTAERRAAAVASGQRPTYTRAEMSAAVMSLFGDHDRRPIVAMLPDDFVLRIPESLPYGGEFVGPKAFDDYFARVVEGDYYDSFVTGIDRVIEADDHLVAPITITAHGTRPNTSMNIENLWLFEIEDGNFVRAQIYADTAVAHAVLGAGTDS